MEVEDRSNLLTEFLAAVEAAHDAQIAEPPASDVEHITFLEDHAKKAAVEAFWTWVHVRHLARLARARVGS